MDNVRKVVSLLVLCFFVSAVMACHYTPTRIYTDDENGYIEFENDFEVQLLSVEYAEDSTWMEYHFTFELKRGYPKKFSISIDNFKLREGDEFMTLNDSLASGEISSYGEAVALFLNDVEQDEKVYQYMEMNVVYSLDIRVDLAPFFTSCQNLESNCLDVTAYDDGIELSFDGRSVWFGDLYY
ncbi:MAG: hypothetical protein WC509_05660 [Candidatus Izemoplasmatales bacterium]